MALLKPVPNSLSGPVSQLPPSIRCDACGHVVTVGDNAINVSHTITVGSPGHPNLPPFQCPEREHWACSVACWVKVAHACIDEHMQPILQTVADRLQTPTTPMNDTSVSATNTSQSNTPTNG